MKIKALTALSIIALNLFGLNYNSVAQSAATKPSEVVITPYKTTMLADGKDEAQIKVVVINKSGKDVPDAGQLIKFTITGDAMISKLSDHQKYNEIGLPNHVITQGHLHNGILWVTLRSGHQKGVVKFEAKADSLYPGSTEIRMIQPSAAHKVTTVGYTPKKVEGKILGADISFLPELEAKGVKFSDKGVQKDAIEILKDHGFNYIRLRIFNNPARDSGYSPQKGFCDLEHTKQMAKRVKAAGLKLLLDFHYSDYWADPQQQYKPAAWRGQDFNALKHSVYAYTVDVLQQLKSQGTLPDMVQVGNEINHGMIWPEGEINNLDSLAELLYMGVQGVKAVDPSTPVMLHIALGGQNLESRYFLDQMLDRNVPFDVIGLSYYPKWHGTLDDLKANMIDLSTRYNRQVMVAEYTQLKTEVNDIAFSIPNNKALGTFIWEPLSTWEQIFDKDGKSNAYIDLYDGIAKKYITK
ncbi:glycosyl hydrolase 53 family protein [Mucilaginibacter jinjuensis]|uniref:Arabinogalactan endo-beta-1,4-galactanase n=1 Tax=Mucilaginibacter jinjuensis TaxID=1176721 RepID=A0ABY7T6U0_9SPHI|nr:glycosyl hydrolase 53 family protein [Mucilaginibacter jinjuensis]WCT11979.1 glycosyl hydrolase 53 family protein [Mucilaginibacter jinjuensis]